MKVFAGGISTETNTFSPMPTGMRDYTIIRPEDDVEEGTMRAFDQFNSDTLARGWEYVFGMYANAQPAGFTTRSTYESLRDELLQRLQAAMPCRYCPAGTARRNGGRRVRRLRDRHH